MLSEFCSAGVSRGAEAVHWAKQGIPDNSMVRTLAHKLTLSVKIHLLAFISSSVELSIYIL